MAQSTYLQVLSCEGVQFSGDLSRQTIILSNRLLAFHLGTNLLAAQVTQLVPVVCLKTNCSRKDGKGVRALVSDLCCKPFTERARDHTRVWLVRLVVLGSEDKTSDQEKQSSNENQLFPV